MWLKKIAQSLIEGSILTSKASTCFTIPLRTKMNFSNIKIHVLLDFGAFACFIDKDFADRHKLLFIIKKCPTPIEDIDGKLLVSRDVTHKTTPLDTILKGHHSIKAFNVIKSPSNLVILGSF